MALMIRNKIARLMGVSLPPEEILAVSDADREIIRACRPYSMASQERILAVVNAVDYVIKAGVPGGFVECGVYKGGCSMAAAMTYRRAGRTDVDLRLFDTFEGMPAATDADFYQKDGTPAEAMFPKGEAWCYASDTEVRTNMERTGYPMDRVSLIKGKVEDTIPDAAPDRIAVLRLDTDWYSSTRHEMEHLYPRLSPGGVLIIDDYGHWSGSQKAVDEYLAANDIALLLARTDYTGRMAIKPAE